MHAAHICCTCNTGNPDETGSSCPCHASCSEECPSTKVCDILCHTCAAMKIWPCLHGTKMPDPGDLGTVNPDCPWTLYHSALLHTSPATCHSKSPSNVFSERGMLYDCIIRFKNCSWCSRVVDESSSFLQCIYIGSHISLAHVIWVPKSKHHVDMF